MLASLDDKPATATAPLPKAEDVFRPGQTEARLGRGPERASSGTEVEGSRRRANTIGEVVAPDVTGLAPDEGA